MCSAVGEGRVIGDRRGVKYLRKEPSSYPACLALDLRLPLLLLMAIAISIQILGGAIWIGKHRWLTALH